MILSEYQLPGAEIVEPFGPLGFMHGLQMALRYRLQSSSIEIGWERINRSLSALAYLATDDRFLDRTYDYGLTSYHLGVDHYFGMFGFGSRLYWTTIGIDREVGDNDLELVSDSHFQLDLHLNWVVQRSDYVSLVVQPYYRFSLSDLELSSLATDVGGSSPTSVGGMSLFGLTLAFYNGRQ